MCTFDNYIYIYIYSCRYDYVYNILINIYICRCSAYIAAIQAILIIINQKIISIFFYYDDDGHLFRASRKYTKMEHSIALKMNEKP